MDKNFCYIDTPIGYLFVAEKGGKICEVAIKGRESKREDCALSQTAILKEAAVQFGEYFSGKRKRFDLPLLFEGTPFQIKVWQELVKIPYGKTASYGQVAAAAGCPKGARAVGMANNKNPIMIIAPCHRVVGSDGKLVGFACGLDKKKFLLTLESYFN